MAFNIDYRSPTTSGPQRSRPKPRGAVPFGFALGSCIAAVLGLVLRAEKGPVIGEMEMELAFIASALMGLISFIGLLISRRLPSRDRELMSAAYESVICASLVIILAAIFSN
jgi:hypothetical protein